MWFQKIQLLPVQTMQVMEVQKQLRRILPVYWQLN